MIVSSNVCMTFIGFLVHRRIQHRLLIQVYKCIRGEAPGYLQELISEYKPCRAGLDSSSAYHQLVVSCIKHKTSADWSFIVQGPVPWNQLPDHIRGIDTLEDFMRTLKTFLFTLEYNE